MYIGPRKVYFSCMFVYVYLLVVFCPDTQLTVVPPGTEMELEERSMTSWRSELMAFRMFVFFTISMHHIHNKTNLLKLIINSNTSKHSH